MELWKQLSPVDKKATKNFKRAGGFSGTDINPQWRMKRMTEVFGPVGVGWGYEIQDRWRESVPHGDGETMVAFVQVRVWWTSPDHDAKGECDEESNRTFYRWTGPQIGGTSMKRTPDEAYKMAITDALGKCFAQLGLGADIYMGEFDNPVDYASKTDLDVLEQTIVNYNVQDIQPLFKFFGVSAFSELTSQQCKQACKMLDQKYGGKE